MQEWDFLDQTRARQAHTENASLWLLKMLCAMLLCGGVVGVITMFVVIHAARHGGDDLSASETAPAAQQADTATDGVIDRSHDWRPRIGYGRNRLPMPNDDM